jgi:HTH-type transcriptional regulator/antitoxin HigA
MIKNEKQYKITKSLLRKFEAGQKKLEKLPESTEQPWLRQAQRGSIRAQIEQFQEELAEYEGLKSGKVKVTLPSLDAIRELPALLIKRRIANGWTQKQLAEKLDMHWQQVQQYEQTDYSGASLSTIQRVAEALTEKAPETRRRKSAATGARTAAKLAKRSSSKTAPKSSGSARRKAVR